MTPHEREIKSEKLKLQILFIALNPLSFPSRKPSRNFMNQHISYLVKQMCVQFSLVVSSNLRIRESVL